MRLFINGTEYTGETDGLDDFTLELGLNESTKTVGKLLSSQMIATGQLYDVLKGYFFANCDSWIKSMKALFRIDICGGINIDSEITSEGIEWCPDKGEISFNMKSGDQVSKAYDRLDSEYVWENGFIEQNDTPIVYYVDQPNWMQLVLLYFSIPIRVILDTISGIIKSLCEAVTLGFGKCDINFTNDVFKNFDTWISGTGRWGVAPLVREMLDYQCQQVGLKFKSSILIDQSSEYYNLALFCLTGGEHGTYKNTSRPEVVRVFNINTPLYTSVQLLQELSQVFNADFRIIGDTLCFERKDYFDKIRTNKIFNIKDVCLEGDFCISYNTSDACSYGEYAYQQDVFDGEGNKMLKKRYSDKLEFNDPYNPAQKGKCQVTLNFAPPRFMFDEVSFNDNGFFNFTYQIDEFRDGADSFLSNIFLENEGLKRYRDMVLSSGGLTLHKLLILEPGFNRKDAFTIRQPMGTKNGKTFYNYNYPLHIKEDAEYSELAKNFYWIDNPRLRKDKYRFSDIEIECDCDYVRQALSNFQTMYIETPYGKGLPEKVTLQFSGGKVRMTFTGIRALC